VALCVALFLTMLDNTVVSVALPDVQTSLHAGVSALQWVVTGYILTFASLLLTGGALGDRFGRRRLLLAGLAVFCAGSALAALAPDVSVLIAARVVQGAGAAASEPGTLSLLRQTYRHDDERAKALGIWAAVSGLALAVGPVLGGLLTSLGGWRAVFEFNLPFGLAAMVVVARSVSESADPSASQIDVPGQVTGALALAGLAVALVHGETSSFTSPVSLALFALAAAAAGAFAAVERHSPGPLLPPSYFRDPALLAAGVAGFAASFGVFAIFFFLSLYLQLVVNTSAAGAAARFAPMATAMIVAAVVAGRWTARSGVRTPVTVGLTVAGLGVLAVDAAVPSAPLGVLIGCLVVVGVGLGTVLAPMTAAVLARVPAEQSGLAAGITNVARQVGGLVAVCLLGAVTVTQLSAALGGSLHRLGLTGFRSYILGLILHGTSPSDAGGAESRYGSIVITVEHAAEGAFVHGLHVSLVITAGVLLAAAGIAAVGLRGQQPSVRR
jgi:EmrB/QacA subfamily drug resistance transporter